jgi:hypothetical protein
MWKVYRRRRPIVHLDLWSRWTKNQKKIITDKIITMNVQCRLKEKENREIVAVDNTIVTLLLKQNFDCWGWQQGCPGEILWVPLNINNCLWSCDYEWSNRKHSYTVRYNNFIYRWFVNIPWFYNKHATIYIIKWPACYKIL